MVKPPMRLRTVARRKELVRQAFDHVTRATSNVLLQHGDAVLLEKAGILVSLPQDPGEGAEVLLLGDVKDCTISGNGYPYQSLPKEWEEEEGVRFTFNGGYWEWAKVPKRPLFLAPVAGVRGAFKAGLRRGET
jgi:hypothetical protein